MAAARAFGRAFRVTPEAWRKVEEIFEQAIDVPTAELDAFLQNACAGDDELRREVESLLANDRHTAQIQLQSRLRADAGVLLKDNAPATPERVGPYRLIRELGRGGMGAVHLGQRDDEIGRAHV